MNKGISEDEISKKSFEFNDFIRSVDNISKVNDYMSNIELAFIGTGSSRTAYLIPKGFCKEAPDKAVCFKVAKNEKGVGQNKTERRIIDKYGKDEVCFPIMFAYDKVRNICLETEIGAKVDDFDLKEYFKDWNEFLKPKFSLKRLIDHSPFRKLENILKVESIHDIFSVLVEIKNLRNINAKYDNLVKLYIKTINEFPQYAGLASLVNLLFEKGAAAELILGDFDMPENYAMVDRGAKAPTLIPIDYGFTEDVYSAYYSTSNVAGNGQTKTTVKANQKWSDIFDDGLDSLKTRKTIPAN